MSACCQAKAARRKAKLDKRYNGKIVTITVASNREKARLSAKKRR